jgi:hypothetical protein
MPTTTITARLRTLPSKLYTCTAPVLLMSPAFCTHMRRIAIPHHATPRRNGQPVQTHACIARRLSPFPCSSYTLLLFCSSHVSIA